MQKADSVLCTDDRRIKRADCVHCAIRNRMLFADLDVAAAAALLEPVTNMRYLAGEVIYQQGEDSVALYSIRTGVVKLSVLSPEGELRIVRLLGPGSAIGLEGMLEQPYHHIAEPLTEIDVCRLPSSAVRRIAAEQPQLYQRLIGQWQEHVDLADAHLLNLTAGTINDRVMHLLLLLADISSQGGTPFLLPSNQDCAALVAARIESVSRVMAEFKRTGVLTHNDSGDWLLDATATV